MKKKEIVEEVYYVGIREPVELRKEMLLSSRSVIQSLKKYELFKELRKEKLSYTYELRRVMEELAVLNKRLRRYLPASKMRAAELTQEKKVTQQTPPPARVKAKQLLEEPRTRLELLEGELDKIEDQLDKLR